MFHKPAGSYRPTSDYNIKDQNYCAVTMTLMLPSPTTFSIYYSHSDIQRWAIGRPMSERQGDVK